MQGLWGDQFANRILGCGYDYFQRKLVSQLVQSGDAYTACVSWSEPYEVEITLSDGDLETAFCDCPYADEGDYCKHMAAVLFAIEESSNNLLNAKESVKESVGGYHS